MNQYNALADSYFSEYFEKAKGSKLKSPPGVIQPTKGIMELPREYSYDYFIDGVRRKFFGLTFETLREIADKVVIIGIIHNIRQQQIETFLDPARNEEDQGWMIKCKDTEKTPDKQDKKIMQDIERFILKCGIGPSTYQRDDLYKAGKKCLTDTLVLDQNAISIGRTRNGKLSEFRILDGATIYPVIKDVGYKGDKKISHVQLWDEKVLETFTEDEIIFEFSRPRTDLRLCNFGYSYEEQAIDTITSFLFAVQYNKEFFNSSTQPPGFFSFKGNSYDETQLSALSRQWMTMFKGIPGFWRTPFLQNDAKWTSVRPANKDLEFNQYIQMLSSWLFALYGMDPAEAGLRLQQAQNVLNENVESKIAYSKSRGLLHHLTYFARLLNRILEFNHDWDDFYIDMVGVEKKDQQAEAQVEKTLCETYLTINELRARKDLGPIPSGDIVSNPYYLQAQQNAAMADDSGGGEQEEDFNFGDEQEPEVPDTDEFNFDEDVDTQQTAEPEQPKLNKSTNIDIGNLLK